VTTFNLAAVTNTNAGQFMLQDFQRVAIVNRGEAAMRFIHAAREFNHEHDTSLRTIALFTDSDRHSMFVREADEALCIGPAHIVDSQTGHIKSSYVDYERLTKALLDSAAQAVWAGWGFVAEHAQFADLCRNLGIVFIGPDGDAIRRVGDKISSKVLAKETHVPIVPWSGGPVESVAEARYHAQRLGFPLLIKATAGGGGHGIREVQSPEQLEEAFERARADAFQAFGNPTVFVERLVPHARHVEVQIIADHYGTTWAVGVRDCTIQRRHQKILEEAPSPVLSPAQDRALRNAAVRLSKAAGYHNAGTVEFLYEPATHRFLFMEMNTRLQVEHPVTECTTRLDLVKLQIHVARGGRLEGKCPRTTGHAIEVRLNAEDPDNHFAPAPGKVERFRILTGPGLRVDTGLAEGDTVPAEFDSMVAKIIAYGQNRKEALARLRRALRDGVVLIKGGASNKAFLLELLSRVEVQTAEVDTAWLDQLASNGDHLSRVSAEIALVQAAIAGYESELSLEQKQFYASALRGRPQVRREVGRTIALRYRGQSYAPRVYRLGPQQYRIEVDGLRVESSRERLGQFEQWLTIGGRRFNVLCAPQDLNYWIEVDGVSHRVDRDAGGFIHSPSPAVVVSVAVKEGDRVSAGDRIAVLEAMKMEMPVAAPFSGRVRRIMAIPNVQVDAGAPILQIEPEVSAESSSATGERVNFAALDCSAQTQPSEQCHESLQELRQLLLGFDVDPTHSMRLLGEWSRNCELPDDPEEVTRRENELLEIFVDICSLFHRDPCIDHCAAGEEPSSEVHLFSYLRAIESQGEGLPSAFIVRLQRALAHYGIHSLDRSAELEQSLLWIYKSHQRIEQQIAPVVGVLERRLERIECFAPRANDAFRDLLDRMISVTRGVFPAVSDMAGELRYRCFDQPVFEAARKHVYAKMQDHLMYLAFHPKAQDRGERIRELVECPQPLLSLFSDHFSSGDPNLLQLMLEILTSRYYRVESLMNVQAVAANGHCFVAAEYEEEAKHVHLFATHSDFCRLTEAATAMGPLIEGLAADRDVVLDLYAWHSGRLSDPETTQQEIDHMLNQAGLPRLVQRIVVAVAAAATNHGIGTMQHFTYRPGENGYKEKRLYRGLHPMMAKRLHLWRLANFKIDRLPSVEDVYLFHGVARENPKDERLFAIAEVRDVTPVRDELGHIVHLPHLERMFAEAVTAIRHYQSRRPSHERLYWNRILLYVWPPLRLEADELHNVIQRLAPATEGLGLEQVVVNIRTPHPKTRALRETLVRISNPAGAGLLVTYRPATKLQPLKPLSEYEQKVIRMRRRGLIYPYEIVRMLTPASEDIRAEFPHGEFAEYDLNQDDRPVPVERAYGQNKANVIVGTIRNFTDKYPEGMLRVLLLSDPSRDLGAIAEPECKRIIAALDLAERNGVPLEWFPISAGAKISMESGVENMDWIARVLRRLVEFTEAGGEVNLVVNGINVGAQPYWNAEATMLMHTRGILIMTPAAAMVLTGKRALDYSGSVSAEDNQGIGGYDRIMGLNGQAQYWAQDINHACQILFRHYEHTYVMPGERFPRRAPTIDPADRDVQSFCYGGNGHAFSSVAEILSEEKNPGRKKSFDIRKVMMAVIDQDHAPLERWAGMQGAEMAVVWDAHLNGYPVCAIGIESKPVPRLGFVPADGPDQWTAGTLFPLSSKKVARAINAASNNRPVIVLANLSGFDGSPESMRKLQLEYGAEIGRAVVNFKGPMVFCVISRYHGGAYVVFSRALNENLEVAALEGTYASVIGGAPAAAVVFATEVEARARKDARLIQLNEQIARAGGAELTRLRAKWNELFKIIHSEKLGEIASEFDRIHSVHRALTVGALHHILPPSKLRPYLIHAIERGISSEVKTSSKTRESKISILKEMERIAALRAS
jgi:acetyl/propionyl-CoA carboxylase alpha subunit/acetyl-CoA carboxylase carboxyltransferase component